MMCEAQAFLLASFHLYLYHEKDMSGTASWSQERMRDS